MLYVRISECIFEPIKLAKMKTVNKFQQRAKVGVAGSFFNQLMSNNSSIPVVGMGATIMLYADRHVAEVIQVSADGKTVKLESLDAEHDPALPGGMGHQNWIFKPTGRFFTVQWRHNAWRRKSEKVIFTEEYAKTLGPKFHGSEDYKKVFIDGEMVVVPGITELKTEWHKINILFGAKNYYYDWEF